MIISPRGKPRGDFSTDYVNFLCFKKNLLTYERICDTMLLANNEKGEFVIDTKI